MRNFGSSRSRPLSARPSSQKTDEEECFTSRSVPSRTTYSDSKHRRSMGKKRNRNNTENKIRRLPPPHPTSLSITARKVLDLTQLVKDSDDEVVLHPDRILKEIRGNSSITPMPSVYREEKPVSSTEFRIRSTPHRKSPLASLRNQNRRDRYAKQIRRWRGDQQHKDHKPRSKDNSILVKRERINLLRQQITGILEGVVSQQDTNVTDRVGQLFLDEVSKIEQDFNRILLTQKQTSNTVSINFSEANIKDFDGDEFERITGLCPVSTLNEVPLILKLAHQKAIEGCALPWILDDTVICLLTDEVDGCCGPACTINHEGVHQNLGLSPSIECMKNREPIHTVVELNNKQNEYGKQGSALNSGGNTTVSTVVNESEADEADSTHTESKPSIYLETPRNRIVRSLAVASELDEMFGKLSLNCAYTELRHDP